MAATMTPVWQAPRINRLQGRHNMTDDAQRHLCNRHGLHGVSCEAVDGKVVLSGKVRSFYLKQLAQEILRKIDGIGSIDNRLEVT
jgi:osmotically-inducible protein OsmY